MLWITVDLGTLDNLDLANLNVVNWEDLAGFTLDLVVDDLGGEVVQHLTNIALSDLLGEDLNDLPADGLDLRSQCVAGLALLTLNTLGEGDGEDSQSVAVLGTAVAVGLDQGLPLLDQVAELIASGVQTVEAGLGIASFNIVDDETDLAPEVASSLTGSEISLQVLDNASLDGGVDLVHTLRFVSAGEAERLGLEGDGSPKFEPLLPGEGVNGLLLGALLAEFLVFSLCHRTTDNKNIKLINIYISNLYFPFSRQPVHIMRPLLQNLLAADNAARKSAEAQLEHLVSNSYRDALAAMLELTGL